MKEKSKNNRGITLVVLILTIIILLILASVTAYTGSDTYKQAKGTEYVRQMQLIQAKVDEITNKRGQEELLELGEKVTTNDQINAINSAYANGEITSNNTNTYRYFSKSDLLDTFAIEDSSNDVMINFITREVVSVNGIKYDGITYYTQYKLPGGQTIIASDNSITRNLEFTLGLSIDGINATITIEDIKINNGTLSYKEQNDTYWQTVINYTETGKTYNITTSKSGEYIVKLQDNTSSENYLEKTITITLTNKPKTSLDLDGYNYALGSAYWAYVQNSDGEYYAWIPRFVYDENNNIKFIKGNSNIATDNTYIEDTWKVHEKFMRRRRN